MAIFALIFNMYWLYFLGGAMEGKLGFGRFLVLSCWPRCYPISGNTLSAAKFLGMSGVNYGLFGYLWIRGKLDPTFGFEPIKAQSPSCDLVWRVLDWPHAGHCQYRSCPQQSAARPLEIAHNEHCAKGQHNARSLFIPS